jgi:VWFA-related protein
MFTTALAQEKTGTPSNPQTATQDETVRVGTAVVQTEVIVTDKSGRRISGLTANEFQLLDEGKPQSVDYFMAVEASKVRESKSNASGAPTTGGIASNPSIQGSSLTLPYEGRHIALVFDDANLSNENFLRARKAFAEYINTKLTPNDMVALISTSGALASLQQFTNDKQRLLSALNRLAAQSTVSERARRPKYYMTPAEAIRIDTGDTTILRTVVTRIKIEDPSVPKDDGGIADQSQGGRNVSLSGRGGPTTSSTMDSSLEVRVRAHAKALVGETMFLMRNNIATLESLFRGMSDLPGRKIAVYLTESFITAAGTSEDISNLITQLIELARRSGVSVYALDAAGLRTTSVTASERITGAGSAIRNSNPELSLSGFEEFAGARALVSGTGGELIANTNSIIDGLGRAMEDSSTYYVVGFTPAVLDNKFHNLRITVKDKPDLVVRARKGYLAANPENIRGTQAELAQALKSPIPLIDLPLELVANAVPSATGEQIVVTGLHVGRNYLTLPASSATDQTASYEVVAYVFAAGRDKPVGGVVRNITFDLAKDPEARTRLKKEGFVLVPQPFEQLPSGLYQMRAVVREKSTGAVGSAYQFFEVPDPKDNKTITLSSLVLSDVGQTGFDGANSFKPGAPMDLRFIIYNLPKNLTGFAQRVKLMDARGNSLLDGELALAPLSGTNQGQASQATRFNLPTARGRYALIVTLKDAKGKVDIERRADLVIE